MFTIEWARSASEYRSRTWTALSPSRRAADAAHAPGETQMMLRTQWDPFEDLRGAQDELREMSPALAHALGLHGQRQIAAQATVEDGVLQIVVPKMEEAKPKRIQVLPGRASIPAASGEGEAASPS